MFSYKLNRCIDKLNLAWRKDKSCAVTSITVHKRAKPTVNIIPHGNFKKISAFIPIGAITLGLMSSAFKQCQVYILLYRVGAVIFFTNFINYIQFDCSRSLLYKLTEFIINILKLNATWKLLKSNQNLSYQYQKVKSFVHKSLGVTRFVIYHSCTMEWENRGRTLPCSR